MKTANISETRVAKWKQQARALKRDVYALFFACRDPRVPWHTKVLAALVVGYAFSPIDLIPDFIPVLGYLDDLILVPLGIALVLKLIPVSVMQECREKARQAMASGSQKPVNRIAAGIIVCLWGAGMVSVGFWILHFLNRSKP